MLISKRPVPCGISLAQIRDQRLKKSINLSSSISGMPAKQKAASDIKNVAITPLAMTTNPT